MGLHWLNDAIIPGMQAGQCIWNTAICLGLEKKSPILAARSLKSRDGQVLFLWVRRELEEAELREDPPGEDQQPYKCYKK